MTRIRIAFVAASLAASFSLPLLADPPADGQGVGGPPVSKESERGGENFGRDGKGRGDRSRAGATERRSPELWRKAFQSIESSLTEDQKTQVATIRSDFEKSVKEWKDANGAREKELQDQMRQSLEKARQQNGGGQGDGKGDGKGQGDGSGQGRARPDPAIAKQLQELRATMPKPEVVQTKLFAVLTAEQQVTFKQNYDNLQKEAAQKNPQRRRGEAGKGGEGMGESEGGDRPARRPANGKPFQFEDDKSAPPAQKNGDGKPSGS